MLLLNEYSAKNIFSKSSLDAVARQCHAGTCRAGTRDFYPALAALVSPVQSIFFPHRVTVHYFDLCVPIAQEPWQAGVLGRLSLCVPIVQLSGQAVVQGRLSLNVRLCVCLWSLILPGFISPLPSPPPPSKVRQLITLSIILIVLLSFPDD